MIQLFQYFKLSNIQPNERKGRFSALQASDWTVDLVLHHRNWIWLKCHFFMEVGLSHQNLMKCSFFFPPSNTTEIFKYLNIRKLTSRLHFFHKGDSNSSDLCELTVRHNFSNSYIPLLCTGVVQIFLFTDPFAKISNIPLET